MTCRLQARSDRRQPRLGRRRDIDFDNRAEAVVANKDDSSLAVYTQDPRHSSNAPQPTMSARAQLRRHRRYRPGRPEGYRGRRAGQPLGRHPPAGRGRKARPCALLPAPNAPPGWRSKTSVMTGGRTWRSPARQQHDGPHVPDGGWHVPSRRGVRCRRSPNPWFAPTSTWTARGLRGGQPGRQQHRDNAPAPDEGRTLNAMVTYNVGQSPVGWPRATSTRTGWTIWRRPTRSARWIQRAAPEPGRPDGGTGPVQRRKPGPGAPGGGHCRLRPRWPLRHGVRQPGAAGATVFLQTAAGDFKGTPTTYYTGLPDSAAYLVAAGDLNSDGWPDVALSNTLAVSVDPDALSVFLQDPENGTFFPPQNYTCEGSRAWR